MRPLADQSLEPQLPLPSRSEEDPDVRAATAQARNKTLLRRSRAPAQSLSENCPTVFPQ